MELFMAWNKARPGLPVGVAGRPCRNPPQHHKLAAEGEGDDSARGKDGRRCVLSGLGSADELGRQLGDAGTQQRTGLEITGGGLVLRTEIDLAHHTGVAAEAVGRLLHRRT